MKRSPKIVNIGLIFCLLLVGLSQFAIPTQNVRAAETTKKPEHVVQSAWQRAQEIGSYQFSSDITQTTYPAPALSNFGSTSQKEYVYLEGSVSLPKQSMSLSLWNGDGSVALQQSSIETGRTFRRQRSDTKTRRYRLAGENRLDRH